MSGATNEGGDSIKRSALKTLTWYFSDLSLTFVIALIVTRDFKASIAIGIMQQTWELILYFIHERAWVKFSKKNK